MRDSEIKKAVRKGYAKIAVKNGGCCSTASSCGCGADSAGAKISGKIGYGKEELGSVPEGADLGLGCGNPVALASLRSGEIVMDLGSGAGLDCFLAAEKVGRKGKVIGVDMTPEMIDKARENIADGGYKNVEFRLGEIENLPAADGTVDVVISNCVVNLSPDKKRVFAEAFRVLKPGGRLMVSDLVLTKQLPKAIKDAVGLRTGCFSGAMLRGDYLRTIKGAGFAKVSVVNEKSFPVDCMSNDPTVKATVRKMKLTKKKIREIEAMVRSVQVSAAKPKR